MRLYPMLETPNRPGGLPAGHRACGPVCACPAEAAQCWQDIGGVEGISLEWMLDRARTPQEALP